MFSRRAGEKEDLAIGSGNGCLAAYLVYERYFDTGSGSVPVEQGYEVGRSSLLYLKADDGREVSVSVGGAVVPVARGELL